jgi:hypothetical protein
MASLQSIEKQTKMGKVFRQNIIGQIGFLGLTEDCIASECPFSVDTKALVTTCQPGKLWIAIWITAR